jgi:hypothetical protein
MIPKSGSRFSERIMLKPKILDYDPMDRGLGDRNALGLGAHCWLCSRLEVALARGKGGHEIEELVPGPQHDAERPRHGVPAKGDLPDLVRNVPVAAGAGRKIDHVARAKPADFAPLVGDEGLTRNDVERFVDDVIPGEAAGAARAIRRATSVTSRRWQRSSLSFFMRGSDVANAVEYLLSDKARNISGNPVRYQNPRRDMTPSNFRSIAQIDNLVGALLRSDQVG